jgi:hypothetical protein
MPPLDPETERCLEILQEQADFAARKRKPFTFVMQPDGQLTKQYQKDLTTRTNLSAQIKIRIIRAGANPDDLSYENAMRMQLRELYELLQHDKLTDRDFAIIQTAINMKISADQATASKATHKVSVVVLAITVIGIVIAAISLYIQFVQPSAVFRLLLF